MTRLFTLYLQYTDEYLLAGLMHLDALEKKLCPNGKVERIIIDNAMQKGTTIIKEKHLIHGGDNTAHEFSGWDRGV
jgi:hypothetical protein